MKQLIAFFTLFLTASAAMAQLTTAKDLQVTTSLKVTGTKVVGISKDTGRTNRRDDYLVTEKAMKNYTDLVKRKIYLGYLLKAVNDSTMAVDSTVLDSLIAASGGGGGTTDSTRWQPKFRSDTARINYYNSLNYLYSTKKDKNDTSNATGYVPKFRLDTMRANIYAEIASINLQKVLERGNTAAIQAVNLMQPNSSTEVRLHMKSHLGDDLIILQAIEGNTLIQVKNTDASLFTQITPGLVETDYVLANHIHARDSSQAIAITHGTLNSKSVVVDPDGNVGVGTIAPDAKLHVDGGIITDSLRIGNDWFYTKKFILTPVVISLLHSEPLVLVDAPGANKFIDVINVSGYLDFNTTAYGEDGQALSVQYNGTGVDICRSSFTTGASFATGSKFIFQVNENTFLKNTTIKLYADGDATVMGDSNIMITIFYSITSF